MNNKNLLTSFEKKCPLCKKGKLKENTIERVRVDGLLTERYIIFNFCETCPYASYKEIESVHSEN
jgi:hypothetical protein